LVASHTGSVIKGAGPYTARKTQGNASDGDDQAGVANSLH
jgi:hypothetical protein